MLEKLGEQTALQVSGDITQFVGDMQKTLYNDRDELRIVRDSKNALRKFMMGQYHGFEVPVIPPVVWNSEPVKVVTEEFQPMKELVLSTGMADSPSGPTISQDLSITATNLVNDAKAKLAEFGKRYAPDPEPLKKQIQVGIIFKIN
jgi:hypothetical protein